ncbi:MAG: hypothetical protein ACI9UV_002129 [Algoriphagus sp.]|jgi:hypothetical protein
MHTIQKKVMHASQIKNWKITKNKILSSQDQWIREYSE